MDVTRNYGFYGDANLADYLRRPVKILDQNWTVAAGSFATTIDPWTLFLENTDVRNRVENYRLLQGTLHLRLAINGGPFFYGRAIAGYSPREPENQHSFATTTSQAYIQQLTQLPHIFLDPTASEGGELVCPFFNPDNWIDLIGGSYSDMGRLRIASFNDLLHANATSGTVNISVYAWMDDVRLAGPTTQPYNTYDAQSGTQHEALEGSALWEPHAGDEYGTGIISKPASAIAKAMGMLGQIPSIKPFARPTEMAASVVGRIAHVFGYSRPAIISDIHRYKAKGVGSLALTDAHEAVAKLTLDSKQELSVDPRTVGLSDVDEMSFDYIKQKECYMNTFQWSEAATSGTELASYIVGPDYHNEDTINSNTLSFPSPMYSMAIPFKFWRGTIKLRFQIVASQMHRGRLRFMYDPYITGADTGDNRLYSRIIDLATNRDFEMCISWNHAKPWLRVQDRLGTGTFNHPTALGSVNEELHNGQVTVQIVNELTSPNPSLGNNVYINCYVSAGEDFEVASPTDEILESLEWEPQSGSDEIPFQWFEPHAGDGEEVIEESDGIPESASPITPIGQEEGPDNPNSHVFFGESFRSIRALMKRYCYHMTMGGQATEFWWLESNFPVEPGQSVSPRHVTGAGATPASTPYNYSAMTYLNWFTPHFLGWRGGLRSKYVSSNRNQPGYMMVRRTDDVDQADCGITSYDLTTGNANQLAEEVLAVHRVGAGHDVVHPNVDGALEVEFPFYSNKRFAPARSFLDGSGTDNFKGHNFGHIGYAATSQEQHVIRYVAAADDFSLFMFIGCPGVLRRLRPTSGSSLVFPQQ